MVLKPDNLVSQTRNFLPQRNTASIVSTGYIN